MTNLSTIEDILENILGLVLGAAPGQYKLATSGNGGGQPGPGKSSINKAFRPATVTGSGHWLIAQSSTRKHTGGWAPEYDRDAVTFYRWKDAIGARKHITRLTVWVGVVNQDNAQGQEYNTTNPAQPVNGSANPVVALGSAWELIRDEIPNVAGPGTSFDPNSLEAARQVLENLTSHATTISGRLEDDIKLVNTKTQDFMGSAESAWYHRVQVADHYLSDLKDQYPRWNTALSSASQAATKFINALRDAIHNWTQIQPAGTWQHPYRVIAAMFNDSTLAYAYVHEGDGDTEPATTKVLWNPPGWLGYHSFDAFDINQWNLLDAHLRHKWADNVINTFAPVRTVAASLVTAFAEARNPLSITDPAPVPLPMPNNAGMPNLTPAQSRQLITATERANLGLPDAAALPRLADEPTAPVDISPFPTTVNGLDVSSGPQPAGPSMTLGDVSQPGAAAHPDIPGFLTGTGGLSSVPGVSGTPGALSPAGLGLGIGGSGVGGSAGGAGMVTGGGLGAGSGGTGQAGGSGVPFGGMLYLPGIFGGPGQSQQERQRNTWLKEDEKAWGTDPACAPAVVGRRGKILSQPHGPTECG